MQRHLLVPVSLAGILLASGCIFVHESESHEYAPAEDMQPHGATTYAREVPTAESNIDGKSGSTLRGYATFEEFDGGVLVTIDVDDAPPGRHAAHIHEEGDCSSADGKSAGGHFNPDGMQHGSPFAAEHHSGDLGNMEVLSDGTGHHAIFLPGLTVRPGTHSVVGRAIVLHAGSDDLTSQPTGAAGGRIGCGVIR